MFQKDLEFSFYFKFFQVNQESRGEDSLGLTGPYNDKDTSDSGLTSTFYIYKLHNKWGTGFLYESFIVKEIIIISDRLYK